jgi:hypothetical protein
MIRHALAILASLLLTGCFDLEQKIALNRDGSGNYEITITAEGLIGEALTKEQLISDAKQPVQSETQVKNGQVVHTERISFSQLSGLNFAEEDVALSVHGRDLFGLGPTHATFRRTVHSANLEAEQARSHDKDEATGAALATLFGNHTYTFSVTLPVSVDHIAPVKLGGVIVEPEVTGNFFQHTVTWRMPMHMMFAEDTVTFAVDFSAFSSLADAHSNGKSSTPVRREDNSD